MFSDELEMLIDAAIADGVITDKERAVLHKRALAEGVDTDELDLIIDARIAKAQNKAKAQTSQEIEAKPDVKFNKRSENEKSPSKDLSDKIERLIKSAERDISDLFDRESYPGRFDNERSEIKERRDKDIITTIESFPIPENPEDMFDLMVFLKPKSEGQTSYKYSQEQKEIDAFKSKYHACFLKAKHFADYHPQLKKLVEEQELKVSQENQAAKELEEAESRQTAVRLKKEVEALKRHEFKNGAFVSGDKRYGDAVSSVIKMFRLPSDKKDLLGLMEMLYPYSDKNFWKTGEGCKDKIGKAYMDKFEEVKLKVTELFPDDPDFAQFFPKKKGLFGLFK